MNRLPSEECFDHFLVEGDNKVVYRFGREPGGNPRQSVELGGLRTIASYPESSLAIVRPLQVTHAIEATNFGYGEEPRAGS